MNIKRKSRCFVADLPRLFVNCYAGILSIFKRHINENGGREKLCLDKSCSKSIKNSQDYEEYDPLQESNVYFFINTVFFQILRIIAAQKMTMHVSPVGFPS